MNDLNDLDDPKTLDDSSGRLSSQWFSDFKDREKRDEFERSLYAQRPIWEKLSSILVSLYRSKSGHSDFSRAAWPYEQAYNEGYKKAINDVYKLLPKGRPQ